MTYKLAKKLKDAGYKMEESDRSGIGHIPNLQAIYPQKAFWTGVSLCELIESCGAIFMSLELRGYDWYAKAYPKIETSGSTPEEAVANLWLELNKK